MDTLLTIVAGFVGLIAIFSVGLICNAIGGNNFENALENVVTITDAVEYIISTFLTGIMASIFLGLGIVALYAIGVFLRSVIF